MHFKTTVHKLAKTERETDKETTLQDVSRGLFNILKNLKPHTQYMDIKVVHAPEVCKKV